MRMLARAWSCYRPPDRWPKASQLGSLDALEDFRFKIGNGHAVVAADRALPVDQKFGAEVPHQVAVTPRLALEERKHGVLLGTVHGNLLHHRELRALFLRKLFDVHVALALLASKLVAGKCEDVWRMSRYALSMRTLTETHRMDNRARHGLTLTKALCGILVVQLDH